MRFSEISECYFDKQTVLCKKSPWHQNSWRPNWKQFASIASLSFVLLKAIIRLYNFILDGGIGVKQFFTTGRLRAFNVISTRLFISK